MWKCCECGQDQVALAYTFNVDQGEPGWMEFGCLNEECPGEGVTLSIRMPNKSSLFQRRQYIEEVLYRITGKREIG